MRQIAAALICSAAWADVSVASSPAPSAKQSWRETCVARLKRAQSDAVALDARFTRGKAEAFVDEEVLPLREHARFRLELGGDLSFGFWVEIGPAAKKTKDGEWRPVTGNSSFPYGPMVDRTRTLNKRTAVVTQKLSDGLEQRARTNQLQTTWEAAADDCLRIK